jgi:hypothetical protein
MLMDKQGRVCGYRRECAGRRQYADLRADHWFLQEIPHTDAVHLDEPPLALRYLKGCR